MVRKSHQANRIKWPFKTGDLSEHVVSMTGLTVYFT